MRAVRLHDTRSGEMLPLEPGDPAHVGIYACGPTVYSRIHIGNARPFVIFSLLKRFLEHEGYGVQLVINVTDVNDKIYDAARRAGASERRAGRGDDALLPGRHRRARARAARPRAARVRDDRADRRAHRHAGAARSRLRGRRRCVLPRALRRGLRHALAPAHRRDGPGRGRRGGRAQGGPARLRPVEGAQGWRGHHVGLALGPRAARGGTSSARRWPSSCSAWASRSTAAARISSFPTTRTRPRRRARRAAASSRSCGCTTA